MTTSDLPRTLTITSLGLGASLDELLTTRNFMVYNVKVCNLCCLTLGSIIAGLLITSYILPTNISIKVNEQLNVQLYVLLQKFCC